MSGPGWGERDRHFFLLQAEGDDSAATASAAPLGASGVRR